MHERRRDMVRFLMTATAFLIVTGATSARGDAKPQPKRPNYPYYPNGLRPTILVGNNAHVRVRLEPRFDWAFALPPAAVATTPREALQHDSTQTAYRLW